ncbi:MAG: hypothetical protein RLZ33_502 [Bacteroidota bacterium]|jgi:hypothetical protein
MKKKLYLLVLISSASLLFSCNEKKSSVYQHPSNIFIDFVKKIEKDGWGGDTARVKQLDMYNLNNAELRMQKKLPFYALSYDETGVEQIIDGNDAEALSKVQQIWAYYYRDKTHAFIISDGVIEEWQFEDTSNAEAAFNAFNRQKTNLYFNTEPYFYQIKSSVYVFHTRAMAFSIDQKRVFEKFVKQNPTKENGK